MVRYLPLLLGGLLLLYGFAPRPSDESRYFPKPNLVKTELIQNNLMGKPFMPGGNLARYSKAGKQYEMFIARTGTPTDAAIALLAWKKALKDSKLVPHFGGYFGTDGGRGVFVFPKGEWIAGIVGLPRAEADAEARILAARLN